jgi:hypothetical protein
MNESEPAPPSPGAVRPLCIHLRSKKVYFLAGAPRTEEDVLDGAGHCWCLQTMQVLGPDRGRATPGDCRPGRDCFESTP